MRTICHPYYSSSRYECLTFFCAFFTFRNPREMSITYLWGIFYRCKHLIRMNGWWKKTIAVSLVEMWIFFLVKLIGWHTGELFDRWPKVSWNKAKKNSIVKVSQHTGNILKNYLTNNEQFIDAMMYPWLYKVFEWKK